MNHLIQAELDRSKALHDWSDYSLDRVTLTLAEEAGEVIQAVNNYQEGKGTKQQIITELIQTAAMCQRMLEFLNNNNNV